MNTNQTKNDNKSTKRNIEIGGHKIKIFFCKSMQNLPVDRIKKVKNFDLNLQYTLVS